MKTLKIKGIRAYARLHLNAIKTNRGIGQKNDFVPADWDACAGKHEEALADLARMASSHDSYI